jgi:hypothetical protein
VDNSPGSDVLETALAAWQAHRPDACHDEGMANAEGYDYKTRSNGEVAIFHHGKMSKLMRGDDAEAFLKAVEDTDAQQAMSDAVGNDGQKARPGGGPQAPDVAMGGNGSAHAPTEFRRKSV